MAKLFVKLLISAILLIMAASNAYGFEAWPGTYAGIALQKQIDQYSQGVLSVNHISREAWAKDMETLTKGVYSDNDQNPLKLFVLAISTPNEDPEKIKYLITLTTEYPKSTLAKDAILQMAYYYEYKYLQTKKEQDYAKAMMYLAKLANEYPAEVNTLNIHHPDYQDTDLLNFTAIGYLSAGNILSKYAKSKQDKAVGKNAIAIYETLSNNDKLNFKPDNYGTPAGLLGVVEAIKIAMLLDDPTPLITELKSKYPNIQARAGNSMINTHPWATLQLADYTYKKGDTKAAYNMYQEIANTMENVTETNLVTNAVINYKDYALMQVSSISNTSIDDAIANIDMSNDTPNEVDMFPADAAFSRGDYQRALLIYKQLIIKYQKLDDYVAKGGNWQETLIARARNGYIDSAEQLGKSKAEIYNNILSFAPAQDYMVRYLAIEYLLQAGDKDQAYKLAKQFIEKYKDKPKEMGSVYLSMATPIAKVQKIFDKLDFEREQK
jgi:hypothetical protein